MRIILLTQWFTPEPTPKGLPFAKALKDLGHDVEVVTGFPNYPGGKIYDGFKLSLRKREDHDGVAVTRLALYPSHDYSGVRRALNYLSFAVSATLYLLFFAKRADVIYAYHPPLTVPLAGVAGKIFRRMPLVIDVQDMWPDSLSASNMVSPGLLSRLVGGLCRFVYRQSDRICVLSNGFARLIAERGGDAAKIEVIPNWAISEPDYDRPAVREGFRVLFAGNMGPAQDLENVLAAAKILQDDPTSADIRIVLLGDGIVLPDLKNQAEQMGLTNVEFHPRVDADTASRMLQQHDALLVHLRDDPLFNITIPSKTQAYLAAGRPIVIAVRGDAADLVEDAGAGRRVTPGNPAELALVIAELSRKPHAELAAMGAAGRQYYMRHLSRQAGARRFSEVLQDAARGCTPKAIPSQDKGGMK